MILLVEDNPADIDLLRIAFDELGDPSIVTYVILESKGDGAIDDPIIGSLQVLPTDANPSPQSAPASGQGEVT